jgi:hypothetical protein
MIIRRVVKYSFACATLVLIAYFCGLISLNLFLPPWESPPQALVASGRITAGDDGKVIADRFFEIAEGDFNQLFEYLPASIRVPDAGQPLEMDIHIQTALESEVFTSEDVNGISEGEELIRIIAIVLLLPMGLVLIIGVGNVFVNLFDRSLKLRERLEAAIFGLALSFLPLLFFYPVALTMFNKTVLYVDNASGSDYRITIDSGIPVQLHEKTRIRLVFVPGGYLIPSFRGTTVSIEFTDLSGPKRHAENTMLKVQPGRCYIYNVGGLNTYRVRTGLYK